MEIVFASNDSYAPHLGTAIFSLLCNNKNTDLNITVLTADIKKSNAKKLRKIAKEFETRLNIIYINPSHFDGASIRLHFTTEIYFRLLAPDYIKSKKCIYLDSDLVVNGSIGELLSIDLQNNYLAAVRDGDSKPNSYHKNNLALKPGTIYFNTGVLVINLDLWRQEQIRDKVIKINQEKKLEFPDQDALNIICEGKYTQLDPAFNKQYHMHNYNSSKAPVIYHFTGSMKPWKLRHPKGLTKSLYWQYRNKTPFRRIISDDISVKKALQLLKRVASKFFQ